MSELFVEKRVAIVCGGRSFRGNVQDSIVLGQYLSTHRIEVVRHGAAKGADTFGQSVARRMGLKIDSVPANWKLYGRSAGSRRNLDMLAKAPHPCLVLAFPGGRGTEHMKASARKAGVEVIEVRG